MLSLPLDSNLVVFFFLSLFSLFLFPACPSLECCYAHVSVVKERNLDYLPASNTLSYHVIRRNIPSNAAMPMQSMTKSI